MAIAASLGIETPELRPGGPRRGAWKAGPAGNAARGDAGRSSPGAALPSRGAPSSRREGPSTGGVGAETHAVVRTVARRLAGRIKQYNPGRGFGFVVSPGTPGDVFFHRSDCRKDPSTLAPSDAVTFDLVEMANGQFKAANLAPRT